MKGEVHFGWILDGTAIQDVWMGGHVGSQEVTLFGTTIRFYDPKIDAWEALGSRQSRDLFELSSPKRLTMRLFSKVKPPKVTPRNGYSLKLLRSLSGGIPRKHMTTVKLGC